MGPSKILEKIAMGSNLVGALALLTMLVVTVADVIMSKIFNRPFPGTTEIITSVMPISVFAFLLSTQMKSRQISIDMVLSRLGRQRRALLILGGQGVGLFLFGLLTWLTIPLAVHSVNIGEHTGGNVAVPIYPAKIMIPLATFLITVQLLIEASRSIRSLLGSGVGKDRASA